MDSLEEQRLPDAILRNEYDPGRHRRGDRSRDGLVGKRDATAGGWIGAENGVHDLAAPGAKESGQPDNLAGLDRKRDIFNTPGGGKAAHLK